MNRRKDAIEEHGPWHYAAEGHGEDDIAALRAETWRAMEEALRSGKARSIGVSNFTVGHLETLKRTAKVWPPAVNQVEAHPLYPQEDLKAYCDREGIVLQAYAALGGQDGSKRKWQELGGRLLEAPPVLAAAKGHKDEGATPAQVLLRWALQRGCAVIPKTSCERRMAENAGAVGKFNLSEQEMEAIGELESRVPDGSSGRLCWARDPLRMLEFE